jgi:hypothetical protein
MLAFCNCKLVCLFVCCVYIQISWENVICQSSYGTCSAKFAHMCNCFAHEHAQQMSPLMVFMIAIAPTLTMALACRAMSRPLQLLVSLLLLNCQPSCARYLYDLSVPSQDYWRTLYTRHAVCIHLHVPAPPSTHAQHVCMWVKAKTVL